MQKINYFRKIKNNKKLENEILKKRENSPQSVFWEKDLKKINVKMYKKMD